MNLKMIRKDKIRGLFILFLFILAVNSIKVQAAYETAPGGITYKDMYIPVYDGNYYTVIHGNDPGFNAAEKTVNAFERYSNLDSLGRCGEAYANVCKETMPAEGEERGAIGTVKPSGWIQAKYDTGLVSGAYLYNRCHLIGWQLTAENANVKNLITGTRYFNDPVMLKFENEVSKYVKETNHHVLYRVTPIFDGNNLLADGVLMEAESVEDHAIEYCVFCYNVQKGIEINYATGASRLATEGSGKTDISTCKISISPTKYTYTGSALKPNVQISNGNVPLNEADYSITYKNNVNAGTADVIINGKGEYTGSITKHFTIYPRAMTSSYIDVKNCTYTGKAVTPKYTVTYNKVALVKGKDYTVTLKNNVKPGKASIIVNGKGNFTGTKTFGFYINLSKVKITKVTPGAKKLNVTWSKVKGAKGYQLQYRLGNGKYKTITIKNGNTGKKTITKLKNKKSYKIRIRAYAKVSNKNVYGPYSGIVTKKTK